MKKIAIIIAIFLVAVLIIEIKLLCKGINILDESKNIADNITNNTELFSNSIGNMNVLNNIENNTSTISNTNNIINNENIVSENNIKTQSAINEWNLKLVNYENSLPNNFVPELSSIDNIRKFDTRAIGKLKEMITEMKKDNITEIWVQSSYRSIEQQQKVFSKKISEYMKNGKSHKEAEELTLKVINKPGTSEHNLGLAVDLNYVNLEFENTKAFEWLIKNAENYGFILRYKKEKEAITKVNYEPWHWRYVGIEHAKRMNEMNLCLEEYIEYLKK